MKPIIMPVCVLLLFASLIGCEEELSGPEIWVDLSPVNCGAWPTDADDAYQFDLNIYNRGDNELYIDSIDVLGDQYCSFEFLGPDVSTLKYNESAFLRGSYAPSMVGDDQISLEIHSNATNFATLVIPVCGRGLAPGAEDTGAPLQCQVPPVDQPDCEE